MYTYILDGLKNFNQINNLELYLQGLQPYVKRLRQNYCSNDVVVNYSDPNIQAAYLLAYYPQYTEMTYEVLRNLAQNHLNMCFAQRKELQACFFGAGPAPETVSWVKYLNHNYSTAKYVVAHTYDIAAVTWSRSREITKHLVSQLFPHVEFKLNGTNLNLCRMNALSPIRHIIQNCCLFFVQNCLNEFVGNSQIFIRNIDFILTEMPVNSVLVLADLSNYKSVTALMEQVEAHISSRAKLKIIRSYTTGAYNFRSLLTQPTVITENLLTGDDGLIPRRNINFNFLAIQKTPIAVETSYANIPF
jgi:hypothetical protein